MNSDYLTVTNMTKRFGATTVLDNLDFRVAPAEFVSLLGPSGCGKTTLLRLISGLMKADGGEIRIDGEDLTRLPAYKRNIGVVFQSYALFPHLTVAENVAFGLKTRRASAAEIKQTVEESLEMVQLAEHRDRPITALSGGQQQRVAVARALAVRPRLLLLDEPFSALDRKLRERMQIDLRKLLRRLNITAIFVTHDQDEALVMSDRIAVMNHGRIEQFADPASIYQKPATAFTLDFVGQSTRLAGIVVSSHNGLAEVDTAAGRVRARANYVRGSRVIIGIRPENVRVGETVADPDDNAISVHLSDIVYLGAKAHLLAASESSDRLMAEVPPAVAAAHAPGQDVTFSWTLDDTLIFPVTED
ncbi:ABC transporter ATP-binding protein [Telmatospirillum sp. J64-1]|uniref:ABC transporter ATP-binding protein n=1 Tax=Telmatospirillum sp. J64-1 TaxID=2502183 RepID=UPI00115CB351|nr:ABC transporter ATP-binding protein [Telmatospirillum sp. J64-1]